MSDVNLNGVVEGILVYAKIAQADKKYESEDTEYSIGILVNQDTAEEWEEAFGKQKPKKFKVAEFSTKFKFDVPEEFEGEKYVYQITLKKDATIDGEEANAKFRPRIFLETEDERIDITESRLVANGSKGKVSYRGISNKYGKFAYLNNVLIQEADFIEYVSSVGNAGDEFGGSKTVKKEAARTEATQARKPKEAVEEAPKDEFGGNKKTTKKTTKKPPVDETPDPDDDLNDVPY